MKYALITSLLFIATTLSTSAQSVYAVDYASQADVTVYVVDYASQADLSVYWVDYESQADEDGLWRSSGRLRQDHLKRTLSAGNFWHDALRRALDPV